MASLLKIPYTDAEMASLLALAEGEKVAPYREWERRSNKTVTAISDPYAPFWFAEVLSELEQVGSDVYQLMRRIGKQPVQWTEIVEVVQARSVEQMLFELSVDDPAPLFKLQRHTFDADVHPLAVQFLTIRGDNYRLGYSYSLAAQNTQ